MAAEEHVESEENSNKNLKRKRQPSVLENFTKLINPQESVRIKSGIDLIKHLTQNEKEEKANDELKYALGRLIRGLGSSNINAKTGFFSTLVAILNLKNISVAEIFEHVSKELHRGGGNSKSENADICSGQILVCGAIIHSNLYEKSDETDKIKIITLLLTAGKERVYLNLASFTFLVDLFLKIDAQEFETIIFPLIKEYLAKPWPEQDLDSLYLLLKIQEHFPGSLHSKFLKNNLGTEEIISVHSIVQLCNTLTTLPRAAALKHPVFEIFISNISRSNIIEEFFEQLDNTLNRSNRNKYFAVAKILTGVIETVSDSNVIPNILTKNFIQQTISTYKTAVGKQKDPEFQVITQKLFETLLTALKTDYVKGKTKIKVLKRLLFYPGTFIFEKVTKSKLVQNIIGTLKTEGVKTFALLYHEVILATNDRVVNENLNEKWWNIDRIYASHLLVKLVNHAAMQDQNDWKIKQLVLLGKLALFQNDDIGGELADAFKETFYSSLDLKLNKLDDLRAILTKVMFELNDTLTGDSELRDSLEDEYLEMWQQCVQLVQKLEGNTKKKKSVFHTLFLHFGLQLFNNPKLASDSLKELFICYGRTKKSNDSTSDEPQWIEVVVDLFLNLLSQNSHLLRTVINCVFPHLCKYLNGSAIHQILSVLDPKNESNPLTNNDEESDEEDDDEEQEEQESAESSDETDESENEENVNDKLRMALHQVLQNTAESDAESVDLDDLHDEEGEKLNEALGQAFKQFKPNLGKNKKQKKDDEALTHFRIRVLDLIEIYLNSGPSMLLTLEIMLPLLQLLEFCIKDDHQKPLHDRVKSVLKKLTSLRKFGDFEDVNEKLLVDLLKSLLDKGERSAIMVQEMAEKISDCCIFITICSQIIQTEQKTPKKNHKNITGVLREGLETFFSKRDCVIPALLFKNLLQINWVGLITLIPILKGFVFANSVRPYRKTQALDFLKTFYHNQRLFNTHPDHVKTLQNDVINFLKDSVDFFKEFSNNPTERKLKERFLAHLFDLLSCIKNSILGKTFDSWSVLGDVIKECRSQITFSKDTKVAYNRLCRSLNISNIVAMKQNTVKLNNVENGDIESEDEKVENGEVKVKKKKKSVNKEKLKLKKETKKLRLQSLSEGLSSKRKFDFDEEEEDNKKIKSK